MLDVQASNILGGIQMPLPCRGQTKLVVICGAGKPTGLAGIARLNCSRTEEAAHEIGW